MLNKVIGGAVIMTFAAYGAAVKRAGLKSINSGHPMARLFKWSLRQFEPHQGCTTCPKCLAIIERRRLTVG